MYRSAEDRVEAFSSWAIPPQRGLKQSVAIMLVVAIDKLHLEIPTSMFAVAS